jgi:hypothetical protein
MIQGITEDPITWRIVVSVLAALSTVLTGILYKIFTARLDRVERDMKGIMRYLISRGTDSDREALGKLIGEG